MESNRTKAPAYVFEVSWEVCNKVGGIHTVVSTKALNMEKEYGDSHILIGPDVWRHTEQNPEFIDDARLFRSWRQRAAQEGLRVKIGHWNMTGKPIVILVDFSSLIGLKDQIFTDLWNKFKLDSISGQWDYIEPALFGYAAGKVVESFVRFNASPRQKSVAQFHEWMTGTGLLYLRDKMPQVGCIFTTHATVLGRCIAGNNLPLYREMNNFNPDELAHRFNVVAKQSLEKAAAKNADCFTTVSDITAAECTRFLGKPVDIVTPNGFENGFTPDAKTWDAKHKTGREKLLEVAQAVLGRPVSQDAMIVGTGGRYEFRNKGIDVFIDALSRLNARTDLKKEVLAFILVPGDQTGASKEVQHNLQFPNQIMQSGSACLTHYLREPGGDPILRRVQERKLNNGDQCRVKIIFAPVYLNGDDGVFNLSYYDLLVGMDVTVFPSYYEPWGYTPLESLAFRIPTITTSLAGFGVWVKDHEKKSHAGIEIIPRGDDDYDQVTAAIADSVCRYAEADEKEMENIRKDAKKIAQTALWDNLLSYYKKAFNIALDKAGDRIQDTPVAMPDSSSYIEKQLSVNTPNWVSVMIHRSVPKKLMALEELSKNLWWAWHDEARELFKMIDVDKWRACGHNPIMLLDSISLNRYKELENDATFVRKLEDVNAHFKSYMAEKERMDKVPGVAYFSMEYGLHTSLKIYSGGLGILAGDYLKEASDKGVKITAVGLLYRYGYFTQKLSAMGDQEAEYNAQDFMKIAVTPVRDKRGNWQTISLSFPGRNVYARIWRVDVGRIELYLLDTDFEDNLPEDRNITHHLYGGDWENRLKQELLLGCGGIRALRKIGVYADVYHCNEGHAAFAGLERLREYVTDEHLSFAEAMEVVRASSLFTTHTPVPAGHDAFSEGMLRTYIAPFADRLKISWDKLLGLGKINVSDPNEKFSMSFLAANLAQEVNGVSWLHGEVSKDIFKGMWPGYMPEELHISYVTNGVHYPTWAAPEWKKIEEPAFGEEFRKHHYDKKCFEEIYKVPDMMIYQTRISLRKRLIDHIKKMLQNGAAASYFTPRQVIQIRETLRDDILTIGFARRFATYKRAHLLFRNLQRLDEIVNNPEHPVQFVFAGKAHPADKAGQDLIKHIVEISKYPQFIGKILFLPNYDMDLAKKLVQGVDIWLNTPTRPQEASGTSGEKAAMNGVMHFSVLDGWWVEGYRPDAGWMLPQERTFENQSMQDELDSEMIYNIIDDEIAPLFYERDQTGLSTKWVACIKNTIAKVASNFTTNRMLEDYERQYYVPMTARYHSLIADKYAVAEEIADWKKRVSREWDNIELVSSELPDSAKQTIALGKPFNGEVKLEIGELDMHDVGVELVIAEAKKDGKQTVRSKHDFEPVEQQGSVATYRIELTADAPGMMSMAVRVYPKNKLLPHRMDFALVKWL